MTNKKIKLGIFVDWYLPAYKAGGPIQSISNLVSRLKNEFDISVMTSNTDLGEPLDLEGNAINTWVNKDGYRVIYLDAAHQNKTFYNKLFNENEFDTVYFNSLFSVKFTLLPFWLLKDKKIRRVLATRGMLGKGALAIKPLKKRIFLSVFKMLNLHKKVVWHATAQTEAHEIETHFGPERTIQLAPNLSALNSKTCPERHKEPNLLNLFFLSRIAVKKNLKGALVALSKVSHSYKINFSIIGPIEENVYWEKCLAVIKATPANLEVNYLGGIPNYELAECLKDKHVLFLPTYAENFGHVIMESWQNGCPVIISDQTPWTKLKTNKLGFDIPLDKESEFIAAIERLASMSQTEYDLWSKSAFNYAKKFIENPEVLEQNKALFLTALKT
jgi:glycosyltransferase involved in cell wall biosynthesis